ncbi:MAG TPA: DUF1538 domain-containing protein [Treponemataceae bacterium]|nr:DUF1538 domain-containing protein [Treponemataceae bacterium]
MDLFVKIKETAFAIIPVSLIVLVLHFTVGPLPQSILPVFLSGSILVILGLALFLVGIDLGIVPVATILGAALIRTRKLPLILASVFVSAFIITMAEPNLMVQGEVVQSVTGAITARSLVFFVSLGVGFGLALAISRTIFKIPYRAIVVTTYIIALLLATHSDAMFTAIAFDSSGASTGSLTVPFFLALGIGISAIRGDSSAMEDNFGTTGIVAMFPILIVLLMGLFSNSDTKPLATALEVFSSNGVFSTWGRAIPGILKDVSFALIPLAALIIFFQKTLLHVPKSQFRRIMIGMIYAFAGLVLFFLGANTGFIPTGNALGKVLAEGEIAWILIPLAGLLGAFIVCAEPSMWVLTKQVEEVTSGNISRPVLTATVAIGVATAVALSLLRVLLGFSLLWLLAPLVILALFLTFFSPALFTQIGFDSGSVATGPLSSTFILTLTVGASAGSGGNPATDAFGLIALIAIAPPVSIQILGFLYHQKEKRMLQRQKLEGVSSDV